MKCPKCDKEMKPYDKVKRIVKTAGGEKHTVILQRYYCKKCKKYIRNIPDGIIPYKQYKKEIINGVIGGTITNDILEYEDYPCSMTMERWKNGT